MTCCEFRLPQEGAVLRDKAFPLGPIRKVATNISSTQDKNLGPKHHTQEQL